MTHYQIKIDDLFLRYYKSQKPQKKAESWRLSYRIQIQQTRMENSFPLFNLDQADHVVTIQLESDKPFQKYAGVFSYQKLPIEFKVIFENINEFYSFLTSHTQDKVKIINGILQIQVQIQNKNKQFHLPLELLELSPEEQLRKKIWELENQLDQYKQELGQLRDTLTEKEMDIIEKNQRIDFLFCQLQDKQSENLKMRGKIRLLEDIEELVQEEKGSKQEEQIIDAKIEEFPPRKRMTAKLKKAKELEQFGKKIAIKIDPEAKHYTKFKIINSDVQKLHGPTYQLYHKEPIPIQGKFYFDIKIVLIKNNNLVLGVISEKNKDEQFSFKKTNCVCYNGYDGSICEQEKQKYVPQKPKESQRIRTSVDMSNMKIYWFLMGKEIGSKLIGQACIPQSMLKQRLYFYFELYWEGNKIRING